MKIYSKRQSARKSQSGMSLIELIMVMVMISVLAGFVSNLIFYEVNTYDLITNRKQGIQNSRYALHLMTRDLRQIANQDSIFQASTDSVRFKNVNNQAISYELANSNILRNGDLLLDNVGSFHFTYIDDAGDTLSTPVSDPRQIRAISLSLSTIIKGQVVNSKIKVTPRNF
ncbi:MAG: PilW family protein [bacterium]